MGAFQLTVIGPFSEDLDVLRKDWNKWLETHREQLEDLRRRMREDAGRLRASELELVPPPLLEAASALGDRSDGTPPNLASLMLLAEADGRTVLLTGDGHAREIERGLKEAGRLDAQDQMHVDVLKVQHHGAKANITEEFARAITADAYVFCGNGEHGNPEPAVEELSSTRGSAHGARLLRARASSSASFSTARWRSRARSTTRTTWPRSRSWSSDVPTGATAD